MAAAMTPEMRLRNEMMCFLCHRPFTDPVMLDCADSFCKACILKSWEQSDMHTCSCPKCRAVVLKEALRPNLQLDTVVNLIRKLDDQVKEEGENWGICWRHREPLNFFCKLDGVPLCETCKGFLRHKGHPVVPAEAAAEECKVQINTCVQSLMKDKQDVLAYKSNVEKQSQDFTGEMEGERQRTVATFRRFRHFLGQTEKYLLAQMKEVGKEIAKKRDKDMSRLSEELSSLEKTIREMEEACEKPLRELLKDIKDILQKYEQKERFETPTPFPPALKWKIWDFWNVNLILETVIKRFKEALESESRQQQEKVTLNPETAHPQLVISEDRKCVTVSDRPLERELQGAWSLASHRVVLGSKPFQSGRRCWVVNVGNEEGWAVGISVGNVNKDKPLGPEAGVWAIGKWDGQYRAVSHPHDRLLALSKEPKKILVSLNYTGGQMAFFDAETAVILFHFSIPGHLAIPYYPFFWLRMNCKLSLDQ